MSLIKLRPAKLTDTELLLDFMRKFYAIDKYPFDTKIIKKNLSTFISNSELGQGWIIEQNKKPIGYIFLTFGFSFEYHGRDSFIDEFYIEKEYRKQGIGTEAIEMVTKKAKQLKVQAIHLEVERHNKAARNLYDKFKFEDNGRTLMTRWIKK